MLASATNTFIWFARRVIGESAVFHQGYHALSFCRLPRSCRGLPSERASIASRISRRPVTDLLLGGLLLDEAVAGEVIAGLEGKERGHPHDHRAEDLITDVEIVVGEPRLLDHGPEAEALRHGREQFNLSRFYAIDQIEYYRNFNFKPLPHPQALPSAAVSSACGG